MPNWIANELTIKGNEDELERFKKSAKGSNQTYKPYSWGTKNGVAITSGKRSRKKNILNFHSLVPVPKSLMAKEYDQGGHDWEKKSWGCEWGSYSPEIISETKKYIVYIFDTAWGAPLEFIKKVKTLYPKLTFTLDSDF